MRKKLNKGIYLILLLLILIVSSCINKKKIKHLNIERDTILTREERIQNYKKYIDSINTKLEWKQTKYDLWKSNRGDLGIKAQEGTSEGVFIDKYIYKFCCDGKMLKNVIDTLSFRYLGSSFYKDKNHVYTHYAMADGGNFFIVEEADPLTFKILGNCYAKDRNHIFGERAMLMKDVDYKTFKTTKEAGCFAKDKNGYYFWDSKINLEEVTDEATLKIIEILKKI